MKEHGGVSQFQSLPSCTTRRDRVCDEDVVGGMQSVSTDSHLDSPTHSNTPVTRLPRLKPLDSGEAFYSGERRRSPL